MLAALLVLASTAAVPPEGTLAEVDRAGSRAKDAVIVLSVEVVERAGEPLQRTLKLWQLGTRSRMVKFLDPARLRGTGILVPEPGQTMLYLPAYKRVRRIVGKEGGEAFMGTGFSIGDLARVRFSDDYTPSVLSEATDVITLKLVPKQPGEHKHASIRLTVRKADHLVAKVELLDASGAVLRAIAMSDFRAAGAYTLAHRIEIDEPAAQKRTTAKITEVRFDIGLSADDFTERSLTRAP